MRKIVAILLCWQALAAAADPDLMRPRKASAHGDLEAGLELFARSSKKQPEQLTLPQDLQKLVPQKPRTQVLVFTATWCGTCQPLKSSYEELRKAKWKVSEETDAHIRVVDVDNFPEEMKKYGVSGLPSVLKIEDGKEVKRFGLLNAWQIAELYYGRL
jgi:thiol-disulfide isomerase/thioredoxin